MENKKYTFFWKDKDVFSQWHKAGFTVDGINYKTAEHWMMWKKAMMFGDAETAEKILQANHPHDAKKLGRAVKGFIKTEWEEHCKQFVYDGNHAKFTQNKACMDALMATGDTELCEASPYDLIWGCGLLESDPDIHDKNKWRGKNWLGEILTKLRNDLRTQTLQSSN